MEIGDRVKIIVSSIDPTSIPAGETGLITIAFHDNGRTAYYVTGENGKETWYWEDEIEQLKD